MKQIFFIIVLLSFFWGCNNQPKQDTINGSDAISEIKNEAELEQSVNEWNYKEVGSNYIDTLIVDICSTQDLEFIDLYPIMDSIASDKYESLVLHDLLKDNGFEITNWGRGNWMEGPRIVSFTMSNGKCECQIDKLYYSTENEDEYKVTERIKCSEIE